jgi:transcriptional regulator with XRE-family HTH domain
MDKPWDGQWPALPAGTVALNITRLMAQRKMTRGQLARGVGVVPSQVTKWLQQADGQFTVRTMQRIAVLLHVPAFALMIPAFDREYRSISVVARFLHLAYRYGTEWPKLHRWLSLHLDTLEEALGTSVEAEDFTPFELAKKKNGAPARSSGN